MYSQWKTWNTKSDVHVIIDCIFNWHTVKPPFNRHPGDQKNCPLKRHVCLWEFKILLSLHSAVYHYKSNTVWSGHRWKTLQEKRRKARNASNLLSKDDYCETSHLLTIASIRLSGSWPSPTLSTLVCMTSTEKLGNQLAIWEPKEAKRIRNEV